MLRRVIENRDQVGAPTAPDPRDQAAAEQIWRSRSYGGLTFRQGEFVALLGGRVVAVTRTLDEAEDALAQAEAEPLAGLIVEVAEPTIDVVR